VVVVRGREYRVCCAGCDKQLLADPDTFLEKDGTPRNAPRAAGKKAPGRPGQAR
jgi:hypothetical protein